MSSLPILKVLAVVSSCADHAAQAVGGGGGFGFDAGGHDAAVDGVEDAVHFVSRSPAVSALRPPDRVLSNTVLRGDQHGLAQHRDGGGRVSTAPTGPTHFAAKADAQGPCGAGGGGRRWRRPPRPSCPA
jgi:hypothetical protein